MAHYWVGLMPLHPRIDKTYLDHFNVGSLIDSNLFTTEAQDLILITLDLKFALDPVFVTSQNLTLPKFIIFPQFSPAGCTTDCQHSSQLANEFPEMNVEFI